MDCEKHLYRIRGLDCRPKDVVQQGTRTAQREGGIDRTISFGLLLYHVNNRIMVYG